ncbi:hypothetical protein, partial [Paraburkholderia sp. SIMBA_054]|uniref:hypothetical protein n=1 Tax=Paraburkholderia sp. SIMBA_054 TaxID=3085795 RepID=UPI00397B68E1
PQARRNVGGVSRFLLPTFLCGGKEKQVPPRTGATLERVSHHADASEKANAQGQRLKHEDKTRMPAQTHATGSV